MNKNLLKSIVIEQLNRSVALEQHLIDVEEYRDAGDVIDDAVVLSPSLSGCMDQSLAGLFRAALEKEWLDNIADFFV